MSISSETRPAVVTGGKPRTTRLKLSDWRAPKEGKTYHRVFRRRRALKMSNSRSAAGERTLDKGGPGR